ncbi:MAG: L,D-transpeptidase [Bdellovibrionales bacterium]
MVRLLFATLTLVFGFLGQVQTQAPQNLPSNMEIKASESQELQLDDLMSPDEILLEIQSFEDFPAEEKELLSPEKELGFQGPLDLLNLNVLNRQQTQNVNPLLPEESAERFGLDWLREFNFVIVINKAVRGATAQRAIAYWRGQYYATFAVSTGRERGEVAKSGKRYVSTTPVGWYSPTFLSRNHVSSLWGAKMPFAVFFNGGIATHAALPANDKDLGTRASGGCVRLRTEEARWVFEAVQSSGKGMVPRFKRNGEPLRDRNGQFQYAQNWRSLIIVVNREGQ